MFCRYYLKIFINHKAVMIKYDLTNYQCPQLFVQFKYQLKRLVNPNLSPARVVNKAGYGEEAQKSIMFLLSLETDISDIERYLTLHQIDYRLNSYKNTRELIVTGEII